MRLDDCSEFRGHRLKSCSRCGHQFDGLELTRLNCDQLNAIKDKESQFGFRWKLSDWAVGEVVKVDVCPKCYSSVVNLIDANEQVEKLTADYTSKSQDFLTKQLNIPFHRCPICYKELSKDKFVNIPYYIHSDILVHPHDYFWKKRKSRSEKQVLLDTLSASIGSLYVKVCKDCYDDLVYEYNSNRDIPIYINGKSYGDVKQEHFGIRYEDLEPYAFALNELYNNDRNDMIDAASYALKFKNGNYIKTEEREMKNVNETKNQNHAFTIERNFDETDRKLFRLEDAETGDFIRLATDEERLIYMVVNIAPVKSRVKVNEKSGSNGVWCVCIQTQDLVELPLSEMVYVYDPRYIAFRIGRFIDA